MMPGLPGTDPRGDLQDLRRLFLDEAYRPDMLKIYPTLVVPGTSLHRQWQMGLFQEMDLEAAVNLLVRFKTEVPPWVRIQRIQREIPAEQISAGVRKGDLRNLVAERMRTEGLRCRCLRCREVGLRPWSPLAVEDLEEMRREYASSGGREVFLSLEEPSLDVVVAYARLRRSTEGRAFVRELRVFGQMVPLAHGPGNRWQHRGLGKRLLGRAESIAREEWGAHEVLVTSGVGVRSYYRDYARGRGRDAQTILPGYVGWTP
jgi:elongator complex protein 3